MGLPAAKRIVEREGNVRARVSAGAGRGPLRHPGRILILVLAIMLAGTATGIGFMTSNVYTTTGPAISSKPLSLGETGLSGPKYAGGHYPFTVTVAKQTAVLNTRVGFALRLVVAWDLPQNISCSDVELNIYYLFGCRGPQSYLDPDGLNRTVLVFGVNPQLGSLFWHELGPGVGTSSDTLDAVYWTPANYTWFTWAEASWVPTILSPVLNVTTSVAPTTFQVSAAGLSDPKIVGLWYPFNITVSRDSAEAGAWMEFHIEIAVAWNLTENISCRDVGIALVRQGEQLPMPIACAGPAKYSTSDGTQFMVVNMWAGWPLYRFEVSQTSLTIPGEVILWGSADYTYFVWAVGGAP